MPRVATGQATIPPPDKKVSILQGSGGTHDHGGQQQQRRPLEFAPVVPARERHAAECGERREAEQRGPTAAAAGRKLVDLADTGHEPPQQRPVDGRRAEPAPLLFFTRCTNRTRAVTTAGDGDEQGAEEFAVDQGQPARVDVVAHDVRQRRAELQQHAGGDRQLAILAQTDPQDRRALQRPGGRGPVTVERQRHGQREECDRRAPGTPREHAQLLAAQSPGTGGEREIHGAQGQRAERHGVGPMSHQRGLQQHRHHGRAEHEGAVDVVRESGARRSANSTATATNIAKNSSRNGSVVEKCSGA